MTRNTRFVLIAYPHVLVYEKKPWAAKPVRLAQYCVEPEQESLVTCADIEAVRVAQLQPVGAA